MNGSKCFLLALTASIVSIFAFPESRAETPQTKDLHDTIYHMDSMVFAAFNAHEFERFKNFFSADLEWYQDNAGLIPYRQIFETFRENFNKENKLTRKLVKSSLEVYPIKNFGAIETGSHIFRHMENGKELVGTFKFVMIWQQKDEHWKITRVISYRH